MFSAAHSFFSTSEPVVITPIVFTANVARSPGPGIPGVIANTIRINAYSGTATIDWGDGSNTAVTTPGLYSKTYPNNTTLKTISISSDTGIGFRVQEANRVIDVTQWGTTPITNAYMMLGNSRGITTLTATDSPTFTGQVNARSMFANCGTFNTNVGGWNMAPVTDTAYMFQATSVFNNGGNSSISNWNVTNVTDMTGMFTNARAFNQPIGSWNPVKVTSMAGMFSSSAFNQPLSGWSNTANLTTTNGMFNFNQVFNQDVGALNMSNVTNAADMFKQAILFNNGGSNSINDWNMANCANTAGMFYQNKAFNQPLYKWNTSNSANMAAMFYETDIFNQDLGNWNTSNVQSHQSMFQLALVFNNGGNTMASWNTAKTVSTRFMFYEARAFNQPMPKWNLANVLPYTGGELGGNADFMFSNAISFNQDLSGWCVPNMPNGIVRDFDTGAVSWTLPRPVWGTCPP